MCHAPHFTVFTGCHFTPLYENQRTWDGLYNTVESQLAYAIRRDTLDLKTQYQFSKHVSAYLDINNVLREFETGTDIGSRPASRRVLTPGFFCGINTRL